MDRSEGFLTGKLLIAMPQMSDPRFERSVIYMVSHSKEGALGLVVNHPLEEVNFPELLTQLGIPPGSAKGNEIKVHFGGPVDSSRGFVLHSPDYVHEGTLKMSPEICLSATLDILRDIAAGKGPRRALFALGYSGWGPGQLESEIHANGWLSAPADSNLIFSPQESEKWRQAFQKIGFDPSQLSEDAGHA